MAKKHGDPARQWFGCPWKEMRCDEETLRFPPTLAELADMYGHYKNGHLWFPGSLADQPAFYLEAIRLFSAIDAEVMLAEQDKARNEAAKLSHGMAR